MPTEEGHHAGIREELCARLLPFLVCSDKRSAAAVQHRGGNAHARLNVVGRLVGVRSIGCGTSFALSIDTLCHGLDDVAGDEHRVGMLARDVGCVFVVCLLLQPFLRKIGIGAHDNIGDV